MNDFTISTSVENCARCGTNHTVVEFERLLRPVEDSDGTHWTHWAPCPTNKEPIIMKTIVTLT